MTLWHSWHSSEMIYMANIQQTTQRVPECHSATTKLLSNIIRPNRRRLGIGVGMGWVR